MPKIHMKRSDAIMLRKRDVQNVVVNTGIGSPSVYHALVVIFLEFFAWGLLTMPVINVSQLLI